MADTQTNEVVINEEQLTEIRNLIGEANEMFRRVGLLEAEKVNMLQYVNNINEKKSKFMETIGGEYGLDPEKLNLYTIDLETGKVLEGPPQQGVPEGK